MMQDDIVQFRGKKEGLELILDSQCDYRRLREELCSILNQRKSFFNAGDIGVRIFGKRLTELEKADLRKLLMEQFHLGRVVFEGGELLERETRPEKQTKVIPLHQEILEQTAKDKLHSSFTCGTVRSGQRIEAEENIVVIGDVNPGAELVAGGSIAVMGTLRGLAHAGAFGDEKAVVAALNLLPVQLRIAGKIAISPEEAEPMDDSYPEMAVIRNGAIIIEPIPGIKGK